MLLVKNGTLYTMEDKESRQADIPIDTDAAELFRFPDVDARILGAYNFFSRRIKTARIFAGMRAAITI